MGSTQRLLETKSRNEGFSATVSTRALIMLAAREESCAQRGIRPQEKFTNERVFDLFTTAKTRLVGATLKLNDSSSVSTRAANASATCAAEVLRTNLPHMS